MIKKIDDEYENSIEIPDIKSRRKEYEQEEMYDSYDEEYNSREVDNSYDERYDSGEVDNSYDGRYDSREEYDEYDDDEGRYRRSRRRDIEERRKRIPRLMMKKKDRFNSLRILFFPLVFVYLEFMFHLGVYEKFDRYIIFPILFGAAFGCIISLLTSLFNKLVNTIIAYFVTVLACVYFNVQLVYYKIFDTFLSLVSVGGAEDAMNFKVVMFKAIKTNIGWIILLVLPVIALIIVNLTKMSFSRTSKLSKVVALCCVIFAWIFSVSSLKMYGKKMYSPYNLFHDKYVLELSMNKLGVVVTTFRDGKEMLFGKNKIKSYDFSDGEAESVAVATSSDAEQNVEYKPQIDENVDLKKIYNECDDDDVKNLLAYASNQTPTMENEYTGMFEGYNVVFVTAESLSPYCISEEYTPTLYKIMNEGFVFENFYNPMWYHSTIDGEYVNCLSQYPSSSEWSFYKSAETYQPYALGNALKDEGYKSLAYHDFNFYYYNRSETHENMGYDFKAIDYGLEIPYNSPYSDLDTMKAVYKEVINSDHFVMYFMSFSGHLPYDWDYNAMSLKNKEEVEKLTEGKDYTEEQKAYIAAQMELDKSLEFLIDELDKAGKLENTLFVVTPDHYPYGLSKSDYDDLAGDEVSNDTFKHHKSCLGIWSASMDEPVKVDKLCASVDVLPTVLNLMGVNYDSRFLMGDDILSESEELVIFSDHSFMTDKIKYNTKTGDAIYLVDKYKVPDTYVEEMIDTVEEKISISNMIIDEDFFKIVYNDK